MSYLWMTFYASLGFTYLLHSRSDFLQVYRDFYTMIRTQFSKNIPISRSNSGGEYKSRPFKELLLSQGTLPQLSCTDTPQQNDGVAERKHRHIMETTRALLLSSSVPKTFWGPHFCLCHKSYPFICYCRTLSLWASLWIYSLLFWTSCFRFHLFCSPC